MGPKYSKQPRSIGRRGKTDGAGDALIPRDQADACLSKAAMYESGVGKGGRVGGKPLPEEAQTYLNVYRKVLGEPRRLFDIHFAPVEVSDSGPFEAKKLAFKEQGQTRRVRSEKVRGKVIFVLPKTKPP